MKKIFLFLTVLTFGLTMTSCLNSGSQNFVETSIVFIDSHGFSTFGKTLSGRVISNERISLMEPKTFKIISYSWDEDYGMAPIGDGSAYKVVVSGDPIDLSRSFLDTHNQNPEFRGTPITQIKNPAYDEFGFWFDDFWLFEYSYKGKEGEKPFLSFYLREPNENNPSLVEVDIRLNLSGDPKEGATERDIVDVTSVDMRYIRDRFLNSDNKSLSVKFYYFNSEEGQLVSSQNNWRMTYAEK